ncbi:DUF3558 domain-containing protein [Nocardia amamiensis]|uniref:DUF3558 domain-containing protein n=1 Tax=Nocardia amamiensis TaxID=404578 RepID=UPI0009FFE89C|nr:DUF3558 domain-containing protein [Nocardia amamiensis]
MKPTAAAAWCGIAALLVAGCNAGSSGEDPATVASSQAKLAVSVPPAPAQRNQGRQDVVFDPCFRIDDATIERAGYDPRTRKRSDFIADRYSFLGCEFEHKEKGLLIRSVTIDSTNLTLEEYRSRYSNSLTNTSVAGREAVMYQLPGDSANTTCFLAMKSLDGVLELQLNVNEARTADRACDLIQGTAETIEPSLPRA